MPAAFDHQPPESLFRQDLLPDEQVEPSRINPWTLGLRVILGGMFVLGMLLAASAWLGVAEQPYGASSIAQAKLSDGTVLHLLAAEVTTESTVELTRPRNGFVSAWQTEERITFPRKSLHKGWVIWLMRMDPRSKLFLPFDDWAASRTVTGTGTPVFDTDPQLHYQLRPMAAIGMSTGPRPFTLSTSINSQTIIAYSTELPRLPHEGESFPLEILDKSGAVLARFDVPDRKPVIVPKSPPARPLPQSETWGDLTVRLESVDWERLPESKDHVDSQPRFKLTPHWSGSLRGSPIKVDFESLVVADDIGNLSSLTDCRLLTERRPWWMTGELILPHTGKIPTTHTTTSTAKPLPHIGSTVPILESESLDRGRIDLMLVQLSAGPIASYIIPGTGGAVRHVATPPIGGELPGKIPYLIEFPNPYLRQLQVTCPLPHVAVQISGTDPKDRLSVTAKDQAGTVLDCHRIEIPDGELWFVKPAPASTTLQFDIGLLEVQSVRIPFDPEPPAK